MYAIKSYFIRLMSSNRFYYCNFSEHVIFIFSRQSIIIIMVTLTLFLAEIVAAIVVWTRAPRQSFFERISGIYLFPVYHAVANNCDAGIGAALFCQLFFSNLRLYRTISSPRIFFSPTITRLHRGSATRACPR